METSREDIFEINDFTNASPWEAFIAGIEKILHQWGLAASDEHFLDPPSRQHCKSERLSYAGRRFVITLEVTGDEDACSPGHAHLESPNKHMEVWSLPMLEMMDSKRDFPSQAHAITKWYGVKQFVMLAPDEGVECLSSQAQAKLMLSSISIAIANTQCLVPVFVQTHKKWRHMYVGVAEGGGIRVNYDTIHLKQAPPKFQHLSGLLDMFKSKILRGSLNDQSPPVHIAVRYTYIIRHWSLDEWPVEPLGEEGVAKAVAHYKCLPVGAFSDPVNELHLCVVWPNLSEEVMIDRNSQHSDLRPSHAPLWTVSTHLADRTDCFLSECLHSFLKICYREETVSQLIGTAKEGIGSLHQFSHALDKLTNTSVPSMQPPYLSSVVNSASQRLEFGMRGWGSLSDKKLDSILKCLFPDAYDLPEDVVVKSEGEAKVKTAPRDSLSRQLACTLCIVNNDNGLRGFAEVWNETVQELRYRWDQGIPIHSLPEGPPDMGSCLFHQKLQMLNCCIKHKNRTNPQPSTSAESHSSDAKSHSSGDQNDNLTPVEVCGTDSSSEVEGDNDDEDDEFFEALESQDQSLTNIRKNRDLTDKQSPLHSEVDSGTKLGMELESGRCGVLKRCRDLVLIATGEPLCVPITQDHTPMTEDMTCEQQNILSRLGTSQQAARVRAKMQTTSLISDMQAFKAANPGCLLDDFVRWYSPRDWIEEASPSPPPPLSSDSSSGLERETGEVSGTLSDDGGRYKVYDSDSEEGGEEKRGGKGKEEDGCGGDEEADVEKRRVERRKEEGEEEEIDQSGEGQETGEGGVQMRKDGGVEEEKNQSGGGMDWEWGGGGWGTDDWDEIINKSEDMGHTGSGDEAKGTHQYVRGRMSERMLHSDNLWLETWNQATAIPAYKQARLFNDTKEAEKVLHFFANLKPCELALSLLPLLLHSAIETIEKREREGRLEGKRSLARVEGFLGDVMSMLATVQQPSLETLPLYQECIGLLSQAEHLLAASQSLRNKLCHGIELAGEHRREAGVANELRVCTEMMLEGPELVIRDPMNSLVGVAMMGLLESQANYQANSEDRRSHGHHMISQTPHLHSSNFPPATKREFILRSSIPCPTPHSRLCPQRMFCALQEGVEFRVAGAFSSDTNFH